MKEAFSRTLALLRRHPILWLPQACAMCAAWVVERLYNLAAGAIWHRLWHPIAAARAGSVFDFFTTPAQPSRSVLIERAVFTTPLLLFSDFIQIAFCVIAFAMIAIFIHRLIRGLPVDPSSALSSSIKRVSGIINVALIPFTLFILKIVAIALLMPWMESRSGSASTPFWLLEGIDWISRLVLVLGAAYFTVPAALRMARAGEPLLASAQQLLSARIFAICIALLWVAEQFAVQVLQWPLLRAHPQLSDGSFFAIWFVSTILATSAALTFLSVAIAVLQTAKATPATSTVHRSRNQLISEDNP